MKLCSSTVQMQNLHLKVKTYICMGSTLTSFLSKGFRYIMVLKKATYRLT